jgi:hypothetical protein
MPERATIFHSTQLGVETTPGTAVAANKLLQAVGLMVGPKLDIQRFRPEGTKFDSTTIQNREWTEGKLSGAVSYNEIIYLLASNLKAPGAPSQAGSEYTWTFLPNRGSPDNGKTYTIEQGGGPRAHRFTHAVVPDLTFRFSRSGVDLDGTVLGKALTDNIYMSTSEVQTVTITGSPTGGTFTLTLNGATTSNIAYNATASAVQTALEALSTIGAGNVVVTGGPGPGTPYTVQFTGALGAQDVTLMTASHNFTGGTSPNISVAETTAGVAPTTLTLKPVAATHVTVFSDNTFAGLGTTQLSRPLSGELAVTGRYQPVFVLDGNTSFVAIVEAVPSISLKLMLEADAEGMAFLTTARDNATKFLRVRCSGETISSNPYLLQFDFVGRVSDVSEFQDSDGLYAIEWTFTGVYDSNLGSALKATVRNTISAL